METLTQPDAAVAGLSAEQIVDAIVQSTSDVFSTMLGMEARAGEAYRESGAPGPSDGVVALVGMAGTWAGNGSIAARADLACHVAGVFMMSEYPAVNDEVLDAFAEMSNMIVGNIKNRFEEHLGLMALSIPTVVFGRNFATRSMTKTEWTVVPFDVDMPSGASGRFEVQVCLERNTQTQADRPGRGISLQR